MKKLDRRIVRTRKALSEALISLTLEKGYDNISIRDLTERADVGYATFYRHYKSKDELLYQFLHDSFESIEQEVRKQSTIYDECLATFQMIEKHRPAVLLGISMPQDHPAMKPLWEEVSRWLNRIYSAQDEMTIPLEVAVNHLLGAVVELIRWWLAEGQDYSAEQMANMHMELIMNVVETVALTRRATSPNPAPD